MYLYPEFHFGSDGFTCDTIFLHQGRGSFYKWASPIYNVRVIVQSGQGSIKNMVLVILLLLKYLLYIGLFLTFSMAAGLFFIDCFIDCFIGIFLFYLCRNPLFLYTKNGIDFTLSHYLFYAVFRVHFYRVQVIYLTNPD